MLALRFDEKHEANIMEIQVPNRGRLCGAEEKRERENGEEEVFCVVL
jgi:hypothetical protein